nr:cobalamin-dependent protein [endosymbiont 'TC1' of Trimyema compressum]
MLATVKGDIHDIGKNIVKVLMENYSYNVIDLGKDVDPALIMETALKENVDLIGLSALMTTTVKNMEETIALIKDAGIKAPVFVGGAVLIEGYAQMIGADFYGKDARESVSIADSVCQ